MGIELKIGTRFIIRGKEYIAVEDERNIEIISCNHCVFDGSCLCSDLECYSEKRTDRKNIHFKKVKDDKRSN